MNETPTTKSEPFANANRGARESRRAEIAGVSVRFDDVNGEAIRTDALNISVEGIFVVAAKPFPIGKRIAFDVHIAGEKKLLSAVGRVEWRREIAEGDARPAGMGVRFIDMEEESTALIRRLLAARESAARVSGPGDSAPTSAEAFPPPARAHLPTLHGVAPAPPMSMPSRPSMKDPSASDAVESRPVATSAPQAPARSTPLATPAPADAAPRAPQGDPVPSSRASIAAITVPPELIAPRRGRALAIGAVAISVVAGAVLFMMNREEPRAASAIPAPTATAPAAAPSAPEPPPASVANAPAPTSPAKKPAAPPSHKPASKHSTHAPAHATKARPKH